MLAAPPPHGASPTISAVPIRDGFKEYTDKKPQRITRIVVVGDSFTWGYGVNDEEIYTERLEKLLRDTEVINLGVTAYGLRQEINYLKRVGLKFDPDIIFVEFFQNDVFVDRNPRALRRAMSMASDANASRPEDTVLSPPNAFGRLKRFLRANVALYGVLVDAFDSSRFLIKLGVLLGLKDALGGFEETDTSIMPALRDYPPELRCSWQDTEDELRGLKMLADNRGARLIVAMVPALQSADKGALERSLRHSRYEIADFDLEKPYRQLLRFATAEGIEAVNPLERFRAESTAGSSLYLPREMHFNARGYTVFAEEIADYINRTRP